MSKDKEREKKTMRELEREMALHEFMQLLPDMIAYQGAMAKAVRGYYEALLKEGFQPEEAMAIVKAHGVLPPLNGGR